MNYANNPQTFMNSYLSAMRNSIITLTLGIGIYGFSKTFNNRNSEMVLRTLSIIMYFYSFGLSITSNLMLGSYIRNIKKEDIKKLPAYIVLDYWKSYEGLGWFYTIIIAILILFSIRRYLAKALIRNSLNLR